MIVLTLHLVCRNSARYRDAAIGSTGRARSDPVPIRRRSMSDLGCDWKTENCCFLATLNVSDRFGGTTNHWALTVAAPFRGFMR